MSGTLNLINERIAEILEEEDASLSHLFVAGAEVRLAYPPSGR
jgi:hypothetical protein